MQYWINVYINYYNNGRHHSAIDTVPEARYSGQPDQDWFEKLVKAFKMEDVLTVKSQRGDISP